MTKPSEWTRYEAWIASANAHAEKWDRDGGRSSLSVMPFPPDPVDRVSDEMVRQYAERAWDLTAKALAVEVLAHRAKDKGEKA